MTASSSETSISGRNIIVFFLSKATDLEEGDKFAPQLDWGIAKVEENETPQQAAMRYIGEWEDTLNCSLDRGKSRHPMSYELSLIAFTESPGPISAPAVINEDVTDFFEDHKRRIEGLHRGGRCPYQ